MLVGVALLGVISSTAVAQTRDEPLATRSGLELGLQAAHYQYEEPGFMKLSGNRGGITGAYTFTSAQHAFSRIDIRGSYGRLKFQGPSGTSTNIPDLIIETRAVAGVDFAASEHLWLSPYAGIGLRYLYDDLRGHNAANVAVGYRRESIYAYAPLGVTARMRLGDAWVLAPTIEADLFARGRQTTRLSDLGTGTSDVLNSQNRGRGYRGSLMFERDRWSVGAWMDYWHIDSSDVQAGGAYIPENHTRETGVGISYLF